MLAKANSLKKKKNFERVFKKGKAVKEDFLLLKFVDNGLAKDRFAIIVSQKISKKATVRNKLKRRIRAIISQKLPKIKKGFDLIFVARPGLESQDFWEIEKTIDKILTKAKIINQKYHGATEQCF